MRSHPSPLLSAAEGRPKGRPKGAENGPTRTQEAEQRATIGHTGELPEPPRRNPLDASCQRFVGVKVVVHHEADVEYGDADEETDEEYGEADEETDGADEETNDLEVEPFQTHKRGEPPLQTKGVGKGWASAAETGLIA